MTRSFSRRRRIRIPEKMKIKVSTTPKEGVCRCGKSSHPIYMERCEDCWVDDQIRWDGRSRRVKVQVHDG
jgi:hypothetical protein